MDDVGDHGASGVHAKRSRARVFEERRIVAVVDCGSDDDVRRSGVENAFLEIFGHQEIVVELKMAAMLLGFGSESDNDESVGCEDLLSFVPRESFEKNGGIRVSGLCCRGRRCSRLSEAHRGARQCENQRNGPALRTYSKYV